MRIAVTGSEGYIGKNLIPFLTKNYYEIVEVDRKIGIEADRIDYNFILKNEIECIVHLAALSGIKACSDDLKQAYNDNISTTMRIFSSAEQSKIPVIFASSQAAKTPKANYYALTKYMAECEAEKINRSPRSKINILRFTNIYGGIDYLETKSTVISKFVKAKRENKEIVINGNGLQKRDFIHISDICAAIFNCLAWNIKLEKPIDIGTGEPTSIFELAKIFDHKFTSDPKSDMIGTMMNVADIYDAKNLISFKSKINLEEQIRKEYLNGNV